MANQSTKPSMVAPSHKFLILFSRENLQTEGYLINTGQLTNKVTLILLMLEFKADYIEGVSTAKRMGHSVKNETAF